MTKIRYNKKKRMRGMKMHINKEWKKYIQKKRLRHLFHLPRNVSHFLQECHVEQITFQDVTSSSYTLHFILTHRHQTFTFHIKHTPEPDWIALGDYHSPPKRIPTYPGSISSLSNVVFTGYRSIRSPQPFFWRSPFDLDIRWNNRPFQQTLQEYLGLSYSSYKEVISLIESFNFKQQTFNGLLQDYLSSKKVA